MDNLDANDVREQLDELKAADIAGAWIIAFGEAVRRGDSADLGAVFVADSWWRDLLLADWDLCTAHGVTMIRRLVACAHSRGLHPSTDGTVDAAHVAGPTGSWIEATFDVRTAVGTGRALVRLVDDPDVAGSWRAWTLFTALDGLHDVEERVGTRRPFGGKTRGAPTNVTSRVDPSAALQAPADPTVVIVGAGQAGLSVAARLNALGVSNLVLERHPRTGDNWRRRYRSLALHDPVWSDHLPYLRFPSTWPLYMSKDQMGDWLELYAAALEIRIATNAQILGCRYDDGHWELRVRRDGTVQELRPAHLVIATGATSGDANRPTLVGEETFRGTVIHSSEYIGPDSHAGQHVLVVGTGTSGHDIAQDLAEAGVAVTMLQRSPTYVTSARNILIQLGQRYGEDIVDLEDADFRGASFPFRAAKPLQQFATKMQADNDHAMLEGLRRSGFALGFGPDDTGLASLFHERAGGYYLDVGAAQLISDGHIAIKQGTIAGLGDKCVTFEDGSSLEADAVILATGYQPISKSVRAIVGDEITDRCRPRWGLDDSGELESMWRPAAQPGLWFAGGNLSLCRYFSKFLALHIAAVEHDVIAASTSSRQ